MYIVAWTALTLHVESHAQFHVSKSCDARPIMRQAIGMHRFPSDFLPELSPKVVTPHRFQEGCQSKIVVDSLATE